MPVGLAFAYLKGQWELYEWRPTEFHFLLHCAQEQFRQAVKREGSFWARRLERIALEGGMI